jgi:hypothetical protein
MAVAAASAAVPREGVGSSPLARRVGLDYSDCVWRSDRNGVRRLLDHRVDGAEDSPLHALDLGRCLTVPEATLRLPWFVLRGLLFERMYHADFDGTPTVASFREVAPLPYPTAPRSVRTEVAKNYRGLVRIGDCVVRAAPLQARALISSRISTGAEARAIAALEPVFASCQAPLTPVPFSAEMMRGTVAEPLYRLTRALAAQAGKLEAAK